MSKTCAVCKTNPASVVVRIADKDTNTFSNPVPVCESCANRISKARQMEVVQRIAQEPEQTPPAPESAPSDADSPPCYRQNIRSLITWFEGLRGVNVVLALVFVIAAFPLFQYVSPFIGGISIGAAVSSVIGAIICHLLYLAVDAVDEYLEKHDK